MVSCIVFLGFLLDKRLTQHLRVKDIGCSGRYRCGRWYRCQGVSRLLGTTLFA